MATNHIHLPPMPKPEDFGIDSATWGAYGAEYHVPYDYATAKTKVDAYNHALEVWKQVASGLNK